MPKFLTQEELYALLQRELPEGVYPEGAPALSYSGSELDSVAKVMATQYQAASAIWYNLFPQSVSDQIDEWEIKVFGSLSTTTTVLADRIAAILSHLRSQANLSVWDMLIAVSSIVPNVWVEIVERWSLANFTSWDCRGDLADQVWGPDWVAGDPAPFGCVVEQYIRDSQSELVALRDRAFRYYVVVYSLDLTDAQKAALEEFLTAKEPARSAHTIVYIGDIDSLPADDPDRFSRNFAIRSLSDGTLEASRKAWFGFEGDDYALGFGDATDSDVGGVFYPLT